MASSKASCYMKTENGRFLCLICNKHLSSKQRMLIHLHSKHEMTPVKREKKRYLEDESEIVPRSTAYRWKKKRQILKTDDCGAEGSSKKLPSSSDGSKASETTIWLDDSSSDFSDTLYNPVTPEKPYKSTVDDSSVANLEFFDPVSDLVTPKKTSYLSLDDSSVAKLEFLEQSFDHVTPNVSHPPSMPQCIKTEFMCGSTADLSFEEEKVPDNSDSNSCEHDTYLNNNESESQYVESDSSDSVRQYSSDSSFSSITETDETDNEMQSDKMITETGRVNVGLGEKEFQALSLVSCFIRNKFSVSTSRDIINTFKSTFPNSEELQELNFEEILSNIEDVSMKVIHYCILCNQVFPEDEDNFHCRTPNCEGLRYKGPESNQLRKGRQPVQFFVFTDIQKQLVDLLKTPGIWKDIQANREAAMERNLNGLETLTDITDGACYRAMMGEDHFLQMTNHNLTAIFNTDGVNLYSSSKIELWPIFLAINELSPAQRFSRNNIILCGLWQGKGKPPFQLFLKLFTDEMNRLYTDGVEIEIESVVYSVKLAVLCGITDLPAKAELLNMSYFNGEYACISCYEPGVTVKQGKGHAKCFPYRNQESRHSKRSQQNVLMDMNRGTDKKRSRGFKGKSELSNLHSYDIVQGTVPDYMHGVLLGVTKTLLSKWFSPSESQKDHFIGKNINAISKRMQNIKPPISIERLPRNLEKHFQHFKATELQSWLLYYSIPCLSGYLAERYIEHLSLLSNAIFILLGDNITHAELEKATDLLDQFYSQFEQLYGNGSCGLNVHNTAFHLPEYVRMWGPIWCWSCFPFEDANSMLLQAVHGTGNVLKQVMKYRQTILYIRKKGLESNVSQRYAGTWKITSEADNCNIAGAIKELGYSENWVREYFAPLHENTGDLRKVDRVIVNNTKFFSASYSRMQKRICNIVRYSVQSIGAIKYFVLCDNTVYAVVNKMEEILNSQLPDDSVAISHLIPVKFSDKTVVVNVEELCEVLVFIDTRLQANSSDTYYVCRLPNKYGHSVFK